MGRCAVDPNERKDALVIINCTLYLRAGNGIPNRAGAVSLVFPTLISGLREIAFSARAGTPCEGMEAAQVQLDVLQIAAETL